MTRRGNETAVCWKRRHHLSKQSREMGSTVAARSYYLVVVDALPCSLHPFFTIFPPSSFSFPPFSPSLSTCSKLPLFRYPFAPFPLYSFFPLSLFLSLSLQFSSNCPPFLFLLLLLFSVFPSLFSLFISSPPSLMLFLPLPSFPLRLLFPFFPFLSLSFPFRPSFHTPLFSDFIAL